MLGELITLLELVPERLAIGLDDEVALAAWRDVDGGRRVLFLDAGSQTGCTRFVVSDRTVFDRDVHRRSLAPAGTSIKTACRGYC